VRLEGHRDLDGHRVVAAGGRFLGESALLSSKDEAGERVSKVVCVGRVAGPPPRVEGA
tara:strand:+ start:1086 stop:1259 length:174 start_codon:yes stop_codon:yes gene_type:complete